jgi:hypothetical protein
MKRSLIILAVVFLLAQFIRPDTALPAREPADDLIAITQPNAEVATLLRAACYDCHSSETKYPWYDRITPVNWWVQDHVEHGREEGNFSNWGGLKEKKRRHFAEEAVELIEEEEMPLPPYRITHPEARLTDAQRALLIGYWEQLK